MSKENSRKPGPIGVIKNRGTKREIFKGIGNTVEKKSLTGTVPDIFRGMGYRRLLYHGFMTFGPGHDKTNKMCVGPAKTQISLGIRPV